MTMRVVHVSEADMDGQELRLMRKARGLGTAELGRAVDMDGSYIHEMETGAFPITRPAALAIRYVLDRMEQ